LNCVETTIKEKQLWELGPQFGTLIWDHDLVPQNWGLHLGQRRTLKLGTPIWDDGGPRFGAIKDPELGDPEIEDSELGDPESWKYNYISGFIIRRIFPLVIIGIYLEMTAVFLLLSLKCWQYYNIFSQFPPNQGWQN
jgi:hypothetical protein